jgi:uncharacterized OB-fold protein
MLTSTKDDEFFWEGIDAGRLLAQRCSSCEALRHPPVPMCGKCQSLDWHAHELSGRGSVFSWLISKHPTEPDAEPRTVVLVTLDEGVRFVANAEPGARVVIGDRVSLSFADYHGVRLPMFVREEAI